MNPSDKLQLIRALEEAEASRRRRSDWIAWGSVLVAAVVLGAMILLGRRELAEIERQKGRAQEDFQLTQEKLGQANKDLQLVRAKTDQALRDLQSVDGRAGSAAAIESAVDNLIDASNTALPPVPTNSSRAQLVEQLFDPSAAVRVTAYAGLLPKYRDDSTLVPEVLNVARENPKNANGIYNALVVLSHMNASSLRPHRKEIEAFATSSQAVGPRVAERARTLIGRLPK
jgi:hypothetical protein